MTGWLFLRVMFSVYILYSTKLNRYYVGTTDNVERRLFEHNTHEHRDAFTAQGIPWEIFLRIDNLHSQQAFGIESHIKRMKSTTYIHNLKKFPELIEKLIKQYH